MCSSKSFQLELQFLQPGALPIELLTNKKGGFN